MASELFYDVFDSGVGCRSKVCNCGITYFDTDNCWDWAPLEEEELIKASQENSEKYVACDAAIGYITIDDRDFVYECPCGEADKYEKFIVKHASRIAEYLNKRRQLKIKEAQDMLKVEGG